MFKFSRTQKGDNYTELNSLKPLEKVNLVEKANLIRLAFSLSLCLFATNKLRLSVVATVAYVTFVEQMLTRSLGCSSSP